jgi:thiamine biosynthesis lipoprotein ApbE
MFRVLPVFLLFLIACSPGRNLHQSSGELAGRTWQIEVIQTKDGTDPLAALAKAEDVLLATWSKVSSHGDSSEIAAINQLAGSRSGRLERSVYDLLLRCFTYRKDTKGSVEFLAGPLSTLYGIDHTLKYTDANSALPGQWPEADALKAALSLVHEGGTFVVDLGILLAKPDMEISLEPVLNGFIVDQVCASLYAQSVVNFRVRIGNVLRVEGQDAEGKAWSYPIMHAGESLTTWQGDQGGFAYYQPAPILSLDNQNLHPYIDPRNGLPGDKVSLAMASAPTAELAQVYALTLFYEGKEGVPILVGQENIEGACMPRGGQDVFGTPGWSKQVGTRP